MGIRRKIGPVDIKLLLPLVITLSLTSTITELITLYSSHRALQCKPSSHSIYQVTTRFMKINSVYQVSQFSPSNPVVTELHRQYIVFTEFSSVSSVYRVILLLPNLQWLPSSKLLRVVSMDRVFTSTKCMKMPGNIVDTMYQKATESDH